MDESHRHDGDQDRGVDAGFLGRSGDAHAEFSTSNDQDVERLLGCVVDTVQEATARLYAKAGERKPGIALPTVSRGPKRVEVGTFRALKMEIERRVAASR